MRPCSASVLSWAALVLTLYGRYDARARVALRRFCHWLHVPAAKMHAMEQMWALLLLQEQLTADAGGGSGDRAGAGGSGAGVPVPPAATSSKYATYLKIGAGALGGAALLALTGGLLGAGNGRRDGRVRLLPCTADGMLVWTQRTDASTATASAYVSHQPRCPRLVSPLPAFLTGGLAAPAIAAGLGSAIVVLHGSAATAAAVSGLGASAAGTAAITGTFGVIGASHAGSKAAALFGG